jgi:hypothetical protein
MRVLLFTFFVSLIDPEQLGLPLADQHSLWAGQRFLQRESLVSRPLDRLGLLLVLAERRE